MLPSNEAPYEGSSTVVGSTRLRRYYAQPQHTRQNVFSLSKCHVDRADVDTQTLNLDTPCVHRSTNDEGRA